MKLYIPQTADTLTLNEDWTFTLKQDSDNITLSKLLGTTLPSAKWMTASEEITLPKGTVLSIKRLYIKQNQHATNNISFNVLVHPYFRKAGRVSFNVLIKDVNGIDAEYKPAVQSMNTIEWTRPDSYSGIDKFPFRNLSKNNWPNPAPLTNTVRNSYKCTVNGKETYECIEDKVGKKRAQDDSYYGPTYDYSSISYTLIDLTTGNILGKWGSFNTVIKKAKEHLEKSVHNL